jgi:hypothetical protein
LAWYSKRHYGCRGIAMMIKITTVGTPASIVLPKELLARLRLGKATNSMQAAATRLRRSAA